MRVDAGVREALERSGLVDVGMSDGDLLDALATLVEAEWQVVPTSGIPDGPAIVGAATQAAGLLLAKNRAYGGSALNPVGVLSRADVAERLAVRADDKISRLSRGAAAGEDAELDLLGYLLLRLAHRLTREQQA